MSAQPDVKGWCPGAFKPMMSGDGLIVRVRPFFARLSREQVLGLCDLVHSYGSGILDLTNRANLQIRGVSEDAFDALLSALNDLGLLDPTPETEARRNILVTPFWRDGDDTRRIVGELLARLPELPDLPAKFGYAIDAGRTRLLHQGSADIRVERGAAGLIVRADGAPSGRPVSSGVVVQTMIDLAQWFAAHRRPEDRRMRHVLNHTPLPTTWSGAAPVAAAPEPHPGAHPLGHLLGAPFGQIGAAALEQAMATSRSKALRVTPWRLFLLEDPQGPVDGPFIAKRDDPLLHVDACPGAPYCGRASVETRGLGRQLAGRAPGRLHVSGCVKGCARTRPADQTFVGNDGRFDLVQNGCAWDAPRKSRLTPDDALAEVKSHS